MSQITHPLLRALAEELAERLSGIRQNFCNVLEIGAGGASVSQFSGLNAGNFVVTCDSSELQAHKAVVSCHAVVADDEALPFADGSFDLVVSHLSLPWINNVPRFLGSLKQVLRSGGLFLAAMAGGESLLTLRQCLMEAELAIADGAGSRFVPMIDMATISRLLLQAGFCLPVVDREVFTLTYPDIYALLYDLRGLGMTAAHRGRARKWLPREAIIEAERLYLSRYPAELGRLSVSVELFFLHGWREG